MAKRHRTRTRTRRPVETTRRAPAPHAERETTAAAVAPARRDAHRPARTVRGGYSRALGEPSATLERAAVMERGFVVKDFRRVGLVVAISLVLLVVSGIVESTILR
ncbi:MAG TPA: hypothetical protein VI814_02550 [Candidatus Limnocylindria bacterium]